MLFSVRGRFFEVNVRSFDEKLFEESLFRALLEGDSQAAFYEADRDPNLFEEVLRAMKVGWLETPISARLLEELRYWSLPSLIKQGTILDETWKEKVPEWLLREREKEEDPPSDLLIEIKDFWPELKEEKALEARDVSWSTRDHHKSPFVSLRFQEHRDYPGLREVIKVITQRIPEEWIPERLRSSVAEKAGSPGEAVTRLKRELGYFYRLLEQGLFVLAGGAVTATLLGISFCDYDLFPLCPSEEVLPAIRDALRYASSARHKVTITRLSVTITAGTRKIQIVLLENESLAELLCGFDVDCCCVAFDGRKILATPRGLRALRTRANFVDPCRHLVDKAFNYRLCKYLLRGVALWVPYFDLAGYEFQEHLREIEPKDMRGGRELVFMLGSGYKQLHGYSEYLSSTYADLGGEKLEHSLDFSGRRRSLRLDVPTDWHDQLLMSPEEMRKRFPAEASGKENTVKLREYILEKKKVDPFVSRSLRSPPEDC